MNDCVGEPICRTCERRQSRLATLRRLDRLSCLVSLTILALAGLLLVGGFWIAFLTRCLQLTLGLSTGMSLDLALLISGILFQAARVATW